MFTSEEPLKEGMDIQTELRSGSTTRESPTAASPGGSQLGGFTALFSYNIDPLALHSRDHTHLKVINILSPNKRNFRRNDVS